jgi:CBS domain-containing protein
MSDMDDLDTFLAGHPPFDTLAPEELRGLSAQATLYEQSPGAVLLVEDGPPATGLWVVVTGSMDVVHSGEVVQVL